MLQRLRDKTSGWIATVVLGLLIIPFAFVGVTDYLGGGNASRLVRVQAPPAWWSSAPSWWPASLLWQHVDIGAEEFRTRFEQARQQQREAEGDGFDARAFESRENKLKVLDQLIDEKVVQLASDQAGIVVGDAAVRDYIASIPAFQVDGKFDGNRYRMVLMSQSPQRTPEQFEQLVRDSLRMEVIPAGIGESAFIGKLYRAEALAKDWTSERRQRLRQRYSAAVVKQIEQLLLANLHAVAPSSLLGEALHYLHGQWPKLIRFLDNGTWPLDSNPVENAIRPFVVGRRSWLFADTVGGANASANLYSLIETAKANNVEPYRYLVALFKRLPLAQTADDYEGLLPWRLMQ